MVRNQVHGYFEVASKPWEHVGKETTCTYPGLVQIT